MEAPAVEVIDLVVRYGTTTAVSRLSMTAPLGAVTAVLGRNGAGKTTTLETCEGYRRPSAGSVRVLGRDPQQSRGPDADALRTRVGVMLQEGGVAGAVRAGEIIRYTAGLYKHPLDTEALTAALGLERVARTPYRRLSGGEQQRVKLALAVVGRPELVFLDEPTAGLDPQARQATWQLIRDLRAGGVSVVLTTHLMDEAEDLADHVVIIDGGMAVASGSPEELTARGAENSLRFRGPGSLDLGNLLTELPESVRATEGPPGAYRIDGQIDAQLLATVTAWCAANGVMPEGLAVERRSLEDVFLALTGGAMQT